jgi:hypothetical protein
MKRLVIAQETIAVVVFRMTLITYSANERRGHKEEGYRFSKSEISVRVLKLSELFHSYLMR